jgi:hypothetical protein
VLTLPSTAVHLNTFQWSWWDLKICVRKCDGNYCNLSNNHGSRFDPRQRRKDFSFSLCVQTSSEAHPASCPVGTGGPFPEAKARPERDADYSPNLVPESRMSRSYISSLSWNLHGGSATALFLNFFYSLQYICISMCKCNRHATKLYEAETSPSVLWEKQGPFPNIFISAQATQFKEWNDPSNS